MEGIDPNSFDESLSMSLSDDAAEDDMFRPAAASNLSNAEIYFEMEKRGLKTTGFPDTDRDILQKAFDQEFEQDLEQVRRRR